MNEPPESFMNQPKKLTSQQQAEEQQTTAHQQQTKPGVEFASVEEMLRHDASQTPVPPGIESRLQESLTQSSTTEASWWRRFFRRPKE
jgi:hypothetical protein